MTTYYTKDHEYVHLEGNIATFGVTRYALEQLGDVVFIELPETGKTLKKGDEAAVIESVKAAGEVYAPLSGTVTETNQTLTTSPEKISTEAPNDSWLVKLQVTDPKEAQDLMDAAAYEAYVATL